MSALEVGRLADGLWWWSCPHPGWREGDSWDRRVFSAYVECPQATVVVDPLVPTSPDDAQRFLTALDRDVERRRLPVVMLVSCTWHARSAAALAERYDAQVWMPPGSDRLDDRPHGALADGVAPTPGIVARDTQSPAPEFVFWVEAHGALIVGDVMVGGPEGPSLAPAGWYRDTPAVQRWYRDRAVPRLREVVPADAEVVICGHGAPAVRGGAASWPETVPWAPAER